MTNTPQTARVDRLLTEEGRRWRAAVDASAVAVDPAAVRTGQLGESGRLLRLELDRRRPPRRPPVFVAAAVVVLLMAAAAAGIWHYTRADSTPAAALNLAGAVRDPLTPRNVGAAAPPAATLIPAPKVDNTTVLSMPWKFDTISADGRSIAISFAGGDGGCVTPVGVVLDQQPARVAIEVISRSHRSGNACANSLQVGRVTVSLAAPLGNRALLHPVVSPAWRGLDRSI